MANELYAPLPEEVEHAAINRYRAKQEGATK